ncbi:uncharacterized protein LOC106411936 [Brassica napus]|uniref:uncharacterized protein LOC106411936 n=1 Tax=Brassica napus TaxID=3708 RepID=UPI0006AB57D5|nr:uncharacterized protein LOC106411936 [Brassica napus]
MNLRSRGPTDLVPRVEDIRALEREIERRRREEEQHAHLDRLRFMMDQHQNQPQDGEGIGKGAANLRPQHPQRQARAIGTHDEPNIHGHRAGIRAPAVENNNFEIKSSLINMIQSDKYHGLALEDPLDHLDNFDKLCGTTKINGVSEDAFKLRLFPFSLGGKAHTWEKSFSRDSITTWDECKNALLNKFFCTSRISKLRNEISGFHQKTLEGFGEAWERFISYISQCPHHGFNMESLLSTFYRGALPKFRSQLDTASNGLFLGRTEADALELLENMAKNDSVYSDEPDRSNIGSGGDDTNTKKELKALQDKLDMLLLDRATQEKVNFVGEKKQEGTAVLNEVDGLEGQEELCFVNANGTWYKKEPNFQYNNYQQKLFYNSNQQGGYQARQNYSQGFPSKGNQSTQSQAGSSTSAPQESSTNAMLKQILESQTRSEKHIGYELKNLHTKVDGSNNDLNNKFSNLASNFKALENQFASMSSNSKRPMGSLPGTSEQNSKETMKSITLRSGKQLPPRDLIRDNENQDGEVVINVVDDVVIVDEKTNNEAATSSKGAPFILPPYEAKLPFPGRFKRQLLEQYKALFEKQMSEVQITMPINDAFMLVPQYIKFLKDAVAKKKKEMEGMVVLTHECSAIIHRLTIPKKLEDPESFTLPCAIGQLAFEKCLCDLGASVSLMPLSIAKRLGFTQYKKCRLSLVLADRSVKILIGILEDLPVMVGNCEIPTYFVVLEMDEEPTNPLILGRPFLTTTGAVVNVKEEKIDLHLGK